jgi:hypothetical protein
MVSPWPFTPFTFRALAKTYGPMWLRCDICRRYARLKLGGLHDIDYRTGVVWALDVGRPSIQITPAARLRHRPPIRRHAAVLGDNSRGRSHNLLHVLSELVPVLVRRLTSNRSDRWRLTAD